MATIYVEKLNELFTIECKTEHKIWGIIRLKDGFLVKYLMESGYLCYDFYSISDRTFQQVRKLFRHDVLQTSTSRTIISPTTSSISYGNCSTQKEFDVTFHTVTIGFQECIRGIEVSSAKQIVVCKAVYSIAGNCSLLISKYNFNTQEVKQTDFPSVGEFPNIVHTIYDKNIWIVRKNEIEIRSLKDFQKLSNFKVEDTPLTIVNDFETHVLTENYVYSYAHDGTFVKKTLLPTLQIRDRPTYLQPLNKYYFLVGYQFSLFLISRVETEKFIKLENVPFLEILHEIPKCILDKKLFIAVKKEGEAKRKTIKVFSLEKFFVTPWPYQRLLWIAFFKNQHTSLCYLSKCPKEIIKHIISFTK
jgi:hypothetical protein